MDFSRLDMTADRCHIRQGWLDFQASFDSQTLPTTVINCSWGTSLPASAGALKFALMDIPEKKPSPLNPLEKLQN